MRISPSRVPMPKSSDRSARKPSSKADSRSAALPSTPRTTDSPIAAASASVGKPWRPTRCRRMSSMLVSRSLVPKPGGSSSTPRISKSVFPISFKKRNRNRIEPRNRPEEKRRICKRRRMITPNKCPLRLLIKNNGAARGWEACGVWGSCRRSPVGAQLRVGGGAHHGQKEGFRDPHLGLHRAGEALKTKAGCRGTKNRIGPQRSHKEHKEVIIKRIRSLTAISFFVLFVFFVVPFLPSRRPRPPVRTIPSGQLPQSNTPRGRPRSNPIHSPDRKLEHEFTSRARGIGGAFPRFRGWD